MEGVQKDCPPPQGERHRWFFAYSIDGDLRFISHHDTLRLFRRALARADLPVRFSEGFNPHPKIMIPLPRPVGIASNAEAIVVETERPIDPEAALACLRQHTPQGIRMLSARELAPDARFQPASVRYELESEGIPTEDLRRRLDELRTANSAIVERTDRKTGRSRSVDIRPSLAELGVSDRGVEFTLQMNGGGSAKPAEVAGWLGFDPAAINHRIRRLAVEWR